MLKKAGISLSIILWLAIVLLPGYFGYDYYRTPLQERPFLDAHDLLKPTGLIGHGYGIIGSLFLFVGVSTYSLRKRVRRMQNLGKLRNWLHFHIFLCTAGPALVFWHTTLKFNGIVAVAFWSMVIVLASGVLGRYVYNRIPKTEEGHFRNVKFIEREQFKLRSEIQNYIELSNSQEAELGLQAGTLRFKSPWAALLTAIQFDLKGLVQWRRDQRFLMNLELSSDQKSEVLGLIKTYRWRTRQHFLLEPLQKIFTYWHVFHIPLATIMFIILGVHVVVAILFGYTWIL